MKKVLIVDDDLSLLEALQLGVEMKGCEVRTVSNGGEAIKAIKEYKPNLVLLDILLSGYDGREIAQKIKSDKKIKDTPFIMLSASAKVEQIADEVGAAGYLAKPFELSDLWKILETHCACV